MNGFGRCSQTWEWRTKSVLSSGTGILAASAEMSIVAKLPHISSCDCLKIRSHQVTIGGQANIPSFQAERVMRSRSDFKSLQPIEEFVRQPGLRKDVRR